MKINSNKKSLIISTNNENIYWEGEYTEGIINTLRILIYFNNKYCITYNKEIEEFYNGSYDHNSEFGFIVESLNSLINDLKYNDNPDMLLLVKQPIDLFIDDSENLKIDGSKSISNIELYDLFIKQENIKCVYREIFSFNLLFIFNIEISEIISELEELERFIKQNYIKT